MSKNSPTDQTEGENSCSIEKYIYPQRDQVGDIIRQNNNSISSMAREGDNDNDKYYVPIQNISGRRIVKPNRFGQAAAIALGLLTFQCDAFLQTLQTGSVDTIKNELANVSILKATMDHMDLISCNCDDESINLADPIILTAETSQKDNPHLGKAMKADDSEDFMKAMEKETKYLTTEDVWEILPKSSLPTSAPIIRLIWIFNKKKKPIYIYNRTQGPFMCTCWYATRRG